MPQIQCLTLTRCDSSCLISAPSHHIWSLPAHFHDPLRPSLPCLHELQSICAITEAINRSSEEKSKHWLTYWIVFGFFTAFDKILHVVLFFLPGFYFLKCIFYIWMFYPRTNGSKIIYDHYLKPQLIRFKEIADKKID
jgi:hypothetical protein